MQYSSSSASSQGSPGAARSLTRTISPHSMGTMLPDSTATMGSTDPAPAGEEEIAPTTTATNYVLGQLRHSRLSNHSPIFISHIYQLVHSYTP